MKRPRTQKVAAHLATILERESRRKGMTFKEVVNATLRRGLEPEDILPPRPPVVTRPHALGFWWVGEREGGLAQA
jgi:hypothetical protein